MSENPTTESKTAGTAVTKKFSVPVHVTDLSAYDGAFVSMKERFAAEMKRIEEEMSKFSTDLLRLYGQTTTVQAGVTSSDRENRATSWDVITKSPLVEGEGENKMLKLQFDLREYDPNEVSVKILNNMLIVSAAHQENTDTNTAYTEFNREFLLPTGTNPEAVESSLTKDGVLTVRAPLHIELPESDNAAVKRNPSVEEGD